MGNVLVVTINSNKSLSCLKDLQRLLSRKKEKLPLSLKPVDYAVVFDEHTPKEILSEPRPDILVTGDDYKLPEIAGKEYMKKVCRSPFVKEKSTMALKKCKSEKYKAESKVKGKIKVSSSNVSRYTENVIPENFNRESVLRIIDANLNRCREGLRVVEDGMRFVLNDGFIYKKIRKIRHSVDKILRNSYGELIKERDSFDDSGRQMPEMSKKELTNIIIANFKRAQESLRVLEEYSKALFPKTSAEFKKQRYAAYDAEKSVYLKYRMFLLQTECKRADSNTLTKKSLR
jgi:hypothetical protein